jgi:hypothetical protein
VHFVLRITLFLAAATSLLSAAGPQFSRSRDLPCLTISSSELDDILRKAHSLIVTANGPAAERQYVREAIKLGVGGDELEIPSYSLSSGISLPKAAYEFSYTYYRSDSPISSVTVDLQDYSRRLSVTGEAADQVEALTTLLESNLVQHSTAIGGQLFRGVLGYFLLVALLLSLITSAAYCWSTRRYSAVGMPICSVLGLVLLLLLPFDKFLAGFALYQGDSSFLVRYGPQISFISLLTTLAGISLSYFLPQWLRKA